MSLVLVVFPLYVDEVGDLLYVCAQGPIVSSSTYAQLVYECSNSILFFAQPM